MSERARRGRGEGTVYRLPDGRFRARISVGYDANGRRVQRSVESTSEAGARKLLLRLSDGRRTGHLAVAVPHSVTVAQWLAGSWLPSIAARNRAATTGDYARTISKYIAPWLNDRHFADLDPNDLKRWYQELAHDGIGTRAVAKIHATLHVALGRAVCLRLTGRNVAALIEPPRYVPKPQRRYTVDQVATFLSGCAGHRAQALFLAGLFTEARQGELLALSWANVDLDRATMTLERTMTDDDKSRPTVGATRKTSCGRRSIAIPHIVVRALADRRAQSAAESRRDEDLVFGTRHGTPLRRQNVGRWLHAIQRRDALPRLSFHELRYSGTALLDELPLADVMALYCFDAPSAANDTSP